MRNPDLTAEHIEEYGFARFYYAEESKDIKGVLQREIDFSDDPLLIQKVKISFPSSDLVLLSQDPEKKLILQDIFQVVSAGNVIDPMYLMSKRSGWNQTISDLKLLTSENQHGNLLGIARIRGSTNPLGSGLVLNLGDSLCWIGMILVHQELRRQGVATAIMEKCLEVARLTMKKSIIGLDATPEGLQVYGNFGFVPSFKIWRCKLNTDVVLQYAEPIKILAASSISSYSDLFEGTNISKKLQGFRLIHNLHPEGVWVAMFKGKSVGLIMTRPGRLNPFIGPLMANTPDIARRLLAFALQYWKDKGYKEVFLDIPERHFGAGSELHNPVDSAMPPKACILSPEVQATRALIRMYQLSEGNAHGMPLKTLIHEQLRESSAVTRDYMKDEVRTLKFLYATGGPEVS